MLRKLTLTRTCASKDKAGKWLVELDGNKFAVLKNGQSLSRKINSQSHRLEISALSMLGKPAADIEPAIVQIASGSADCTVSISMSIGSGKRSLEAICMPDKTIMWESDITNVIAKYMANIFSSDNILERINDPNNKHGDLEVLCMKDGIHIRWQLKKTSIESHAWSIRYDEEIISYETINVTISDQQMTSGFLTRLEHTIHDTILAKTSFVKNEYNCFVPV